MKEISGDEFKQMLESGKPVAVVDIREANEYTDWHIHNSTNIPVYNALNRGNTDALTPHIKTLPNDRPIVTVCRMGNTSKYAAHILESSGYDAFSLIGGMRGWSTMWSEARIQLEARTDAVFFQVRRNGKGCLSYMLGSHGEAAIVDPCVDESVYIQITKREGLMIKHVLETHVHADHLSRARALCQATDAQHKLPTNKRAIYPYTPIRDGDKLSIGGGISIEVIATPGHTGESVCYLVEGEALLTGDTLFVESVGRPDLEKGDAGANAGANMLYHSLQERILKLPDSVQIYPAHYSQPIGFDGAPVSAELSQLKTTIDLLATSEENFVQSILSSLRAKPPNFHAIIAINEGKADLGLTNPIDLEAGPNRCAATS
jgi:glyoxylase-like metal-dependent hydrolase (beta-lactamase superfamily II)